MHRSTHARLKHHREQVIAVQPRDLNGTLGVLSFSPSFSTKIMNYPRIGSVSLTPGKSLYKWRTGFAAVDLALLEKYFYELKSGFCASL